MQPAETETRRTAESGRVARLDEDAIHLARLVIDAERALDPSSSVFRELVSQARRILDPCLPALPTPDGGKLSAWQARKAVAFIEDHADQPIRVGEVAAAVRLSASYFSHAFRACFGIHVSGYIAMRRIERAKVLMLESPDRLADVALACGFSDQAHFCRAFGAATGQTPARWRRARRPIASIAKKPRCANSAKAAPACAHGMVP